MNISAFPWHTPLIVRFQCGLERTFSSVYEALDFLENEWPLRHGERYEHAVNLCRNALDRSTASAVAREAFVAACLEAGMPVAAALPAWSISASARARMPPRPVAQPGLQA